MSKNLKKKRPIESEEESEDDYEEEEKLSDEEEEEDDDEEYSEHEKPNRKRKRPISKNRRKKKEINRFLDIDAEVSEGEESSSASDASDLSERGKKEKREVKELEKLLAQTKKNRMPFLNMTEQEIMERYDREEGEEEEDGEEPFLPDLPAALQQSYLLNQLPTMRDPKVFAVRCREKMEREAVLKLMYKFNFFMGKKEELMIFSASSIDKFPGYVYIESKNEVNVRTAINDIEGLMFGVNSKISIIPIKEVPLIYTIDESKQIKITKGQFVRIKKGLYANDLARVLEVVDLNEVEVKIVPRLFSGDKQEIKKFNATNMHLRPPKQLYKSPNSDENDYTGTHTLNGQKFVGGLLISKFRITNLIIKDVIPTLAEIDQFILGESEETKDKVYFEMLEILDKTSKEINKFQKGDQVKVISGPLINLIGMVISATDRKISVLPNQDDLNVSLTFQPAELIKDFQLGELVRANGGRNEGKTGRVIKITDSTATVLMSNQKEQFMAFVNDLVKSNEVMSDPKNNETKEQYKKFDLVKLMGHDSAGIVLKVEYDGLNIMNEKGNVRNINYLEIENKVTHRNSVFQNNYKDNITIESTVKVLDGLYKGKVGTVKHIFKDVLFLFNQEFIPTNGIFVEKGNNCTLLNPNLNNKNRPFPNSTPISQNPENKSFAKKKKDNLIGQSCIVVRGPWKGFEGKIKDADDKTVRIELLAKAKILTLGREFVSSKEGMEFGEADDGKTVSDSYGRTPVYSTSRGNYNINSPFHGGQSPAYMASPGLG